MPKTSVSPRTARSVQLETSLTAPFEVAGFDPVFNDDATKFTIDLPTPECHLRFDQIVANLRNSGQAVDLKYDLKDEDVGMVATITCPKFPETGPTDQNSAKEFAKFTESAQQRYTNLGAWRTAVKAAGLQVQNNLEDGTYYAMKDGEEVATWYKSDNWGEVDTAFAAVPQTEAKVEPLSWNQAVKLAGKNDEGLAYLLYKTVANKVAGQSTNTAFLNACEDENFYADDPRTVAKRQQAARILRTLGMAVTNWKDLKESVIEGTDDKVLTTTTRGDKTHYKLGNERVAFYNTVEGYGAIYGSLDLAFITDKDFVVGRKELIFVGSLNDFQSKLASKGYMVQGARQNESSAVQDYEDWRKAVKAAYPEVADKLKFKGRVEDGTNTISAEVSGEDRSYGVYYPEDEYGVVFGTNESGTNGPASVDVLDVPDDVQVMPEFKAWVDHLETEFARAYQIFVSDSDDCAKAYVQSSADGDVNSAAVSTFQYDTKRFETNKANEAVNYKSLKLGMKIRVQGRNGVGTIVSDPSGPNSTEWSGFLAQFGGEIVTVYADEVLSVVKEGVGDPEEGWCVVSSDRPRIVIGGPYLDRADALAYKQSVPPAQSNGWLVLWGKEASDGSGEYVQTRAVNPTETVNAFTGAVAYKNRKGLTESFQINQDTRAPVYRKHLRTGNTSQLIGDSETSEKLEAGVYHVFKDFNGNTFFERKAIRSDELLRFEDGRREHVLDEIRQFWSLRENFAALGLGHKRGVLMFGPPGGGKSCIIKQVVEDAVNSDNVVIYPKSLDGLASIIREFRDVEPDRHILCVLEDVDGLIQYSEHSMLELFDGDDQVNHVLFLATTNYPDRLPPRVMRSGRFDTKIEIKQIPREGRIAYLQSKVGTRCKPEDIENYADLTEDFSFAQMREFVAATFALNQEPKAAVTRIRRNFTESRTLLKEAEDIEIWVVTTPNANSTLDDILFKSSVRKMERQYLGGLQAVEIAQVFAADEEAEATEFAQQLLDTYSEASRLREATTQWQVVDAKTGEELGRIERYRRSVGTLSKPEYRIWYRNPDNHDMNADSRGVLAAAYAYDKNAPNNTRKHKVIPLN